VTGVPPRALILAAGLGTRAAPLTRVRAKPAFPVAGVTLVQRIVEWLARQGVTDLVVNLHHRPESITAILGDGRPLGVTVRYSREPTLLGSAGGPRHALPLLEGGPFFVVNGDTLADVDLTALAEHHRASRALVTMAVMPSQTPGRYGGVRVDADGWITGFDRLGESPEARHFIGIQVAEPEAFASLADNEPAESVWGHYPTLLGQMPRALAAFECGPDFVDIGTADDYLRASVRLAGGDPTRLIGRGCRVAPDARLVRTVLWDDVTLDGGVELTECIVTDGVRVEAGRRYRRSVLLDAAAAGGMSGGERDGCLHVVPLDGVGRTAAMRPVP
jgi:NDP-sugar pyrophosphorylase family protein